MSNPNEEIFPIDENDDDVVVTLDMEDGSEVTCEILTIFEMGEQDYIALTPIIENDKEINSDDVYFYRYFEDENGFPSLENITDEDEFEAVIDRFDEFLDEVEFGEDNFDE